MREPPTFYLAHPLASRQWVRDWQAYIQRSFGIRLLNPFYDTGGRGDIAKMDSGEAGPDECDFKEVVEGDLADLHKCLGVVGIVDGAISYGTIMEVVYAHEAGKPIYLIVTNQRHKHPWLVYHATRIFKSLEEFEVFLGEEFPCGIEIQSTVP